MSKSMLAAISTMLIIWCIVQLTMVTKIYAIVIVSIILTLSVLDIIYNIVKLINK